MAAEIILFYRTDLILIYFNQLHVLVDIIHFIDSISWQYRTVRAPNVAHKLAAGPKRKLQDLYKNVFWIPVGHVSKTLCKDLPRASPISVCNGLIFRGPKPRTQVSHRMWVSVGAYLVSILPPANASLTFQRQRPSHSTYAAVTKPADMG